MLDNLPVASRLVVIFLLPVLALAVLAAGRLQSTITSGLQADAERRMLAVASDLSAVAYELQLERDLAAASGGAPGRPVRGRLHKQRARTDQVLAAAWGRARDGASPAAPAALGRAATTIQATLARLPTARRSVDLSSIDSFGRLSSYDALVDALLGRATAIATRTGTRSSTAAPPPASPSPAPKRPPPTSAASWPWRCRPGGSNRETGPGSWPASGPSAPGSGSSSCSPPTSSGKPTGGCSTASRSR